MNKMLRVALVLGCVVALAASAGSGNYYVEYRPLSATTTKTKADVVQKAVIAFADAGMEVETSDSNAGIAVTKWWSGTGIASEQARFRIRVSSSDAGTYEIVSVCQRKSALTSEWVEECTDNSKRPRHLVETMANIEAALR